MSDTNKDTKHVNLSNARAEDQLEALKKIAAGDFCPFCQADYIEKEHKKPIIKTGDHWIATENRWPYKNTKHHLLFIHRRHVTSIADLCDEDWNELRKMVMEISQKMNIPGATFVMRSGDSRYTGGTVTHLHAQLISGNPDSGEPVLARVG